MKKNKKIESLAENSVKDLVDETFFQELSAKQKFQIEGNTVPVKNEKKPFLKKLSGHIALASTSIAALIVILCVAFILPQTIPEIPEEPQYGFGEIISKSISIESINERIVGLQIAPDNITYTAVNIHAPSGEELYYDIVYEVGTETRVRMADVSVIFNPDYDYLRLPTNQEMQYKGVSVFYYLKKEVAPDGVISLDYAYFEKDGYRIGIKYDEYTFEEPLGLTDFLDRFFIFD